MCGGGPGDTQRVHGVAAPDDDDLGIFDDDRPGGLLAVNFHVADDVRHDDLGRTGGIVSHGADESAHQVGEAADAGSGCIDFAQIVPAAGCGEYGVLTVLLDDAIEVLADQFGGFVPADAYEFALAAFGRVGRVSVLQEPLAHHGVLDASRGMNEAGHVRGHLVDGAILSEREGLDDMAVLRLEFADAPEGGAGACVRFRHCRIGCSQHGWAEQGRGDAGSCRVAHELTTSYVMVT